MLLTELSSPTHIHYEESDLSFLHDSPRHFNCGIQLICTDGEAVVSTGAQQFHLKKILLSPLRNSPYSSTKLFTKPVYVDIQCHS